MKERYIASGVRRQSQENPSLQCSICGQWKRLFGKDKDGFHVQRFFGGCDLTTDREYIEHSPDVCAECCKEHHRKL